MLPGNMLPAISNMLPVSQYPVSCISVTLCIQQQTGNKLATQHVAGNKQHVEGNMLPGVNAALDAVFVTPVTLLRC